ncbi:MAG: RNA methyltransferase [Verrucomicrobiales bacterium]|nr:RNA methyltransferase [Verrucomicrobiales bacterium]
MSEPSTAELLDFLGEYVTENKRSKMARALDFRTRHLSIVLEDIYQPHNASACLRSCDCLGVQDIHVIEKRNEYRPNREVAMGSAKWLTLRQYNDTTDCLERLKSAGYRIIATTPNEDGFTPVTLPLEGPAALLFGTEEQGLSEEALALADETLRLPMFGFTQSFNISVTVAVTLSRLIERLHSADEAADWKLGREERDELLLEWYRKIVTSHELLEDRQFGNG